MTLTAAKRPVVLIVEDEFVLRMNAVEMIKEAGLGNRYASKVRARVAS